MNHRLLVYLLGLGVILAIVAGGVYWQWPGAMPFLGPPPAEADDNDHDGGFLDKFKIAWDPSAVNTEIALGERETIRTSFTSPRHLTDVIIRVPPELEEIVQVVPKEFNRVRRGETVPVDIIASVPGDAIPGPKVGLIRLFREVRVGRKTFVLPLILARPLRVSVLVTVVPLPPDPGDSGKATLEGIDSDGDGVRDDVQRYIALTYPTSGRTRLALRQHAQAVADFVVPNQMDPSVLAQKLLDSIECLALIRPDDATSIAASLRAVVYDTPDRYRSYLSAQGGAAGLNLITRPPEEVVGACAFDINAVAD
jgi:hypothetical protein